MRLNLLRLWALIALVIACAATALAVDRLYLKDGDFHLVREYQVLQDRVRYYSTERGDWEEIPLELVDLKRTREEASEKKASLEADAKAQAEEDAAERAVAQQLAKIPVDPGVYYIKGDELPAVEMAEMKVVTDKKRSILKAISPIPLITGKATVELDGPTAKLKVEGNRPEFYFRLTAEERFGLVKLSANKKTNSRIVMNLTIVEIQKEREVGEDFQLIETFKKQEGDLMYKIWPQKALEPGEYALMQYTEGKVNPKVWDFSVGK
jgi:hypothetical protein